MAKTIYNMPCAFIIPITVSVIPAITSNLTLEKHEDVTKTEESAARITGLLSLPCAVGLSVLAAPIMSLLAGHTGERLTLGAQLMTIMGINVFFYAVIQYTTAMMQAHGLAHVPVMHMLVCGVGRLAVVYILSGNPYIGILAAPIGTGLCYLSIGILNLTAIRKFVPQKPKLLKNFLRPLLSAAIMGVSVWGAYQVLSRFLSAHSRLESAILCAGPILVGVAVYFVCVILFKAIKKEDCMLLPKGDKLAKLLKL
jgi:stage V sporulation protein B